MSRSGRSSGIFAGLAGVALLSGCAAGLPVEKVPLRTADPFPADAVLAPLRFEKGTIRLRRGSLIGAYRDGLECLNGGREIHWGTGGRTLVPSPIEYQDLFFEQFTAAGYRVAGDPDSLFDSRRRDRLSASYLVAAQIEDIRVTLCEVASVLTGAPRHAQTGEGMVRVYWQVFSPLERQVVAEGRSAGWFEQTTPTADALWVLVSEAFAQAAANYAADPAVRALVQAPRPDRVALQRRQVSAQGEKTLSLPARPLSTTPLDRHSEEVRRAVVTVRSADGHGSGFFVAPHLIVTNHHVVGEASGVKIILTTGREMFGDVIRRDALTDLALIETEAIGIDPLPLHTRPLRLAEPVYAIGTPLKESLRASISRGIVSRIGGNRHGVPEIQSDVMIHGGNSGGPLLDAYGNVVGIAVEMLARPEDGTGTGLSFFRPVDSLTRALKLRPRHPNEPEPDGEE